MHRHRHLTASFGHDSQCAVNSLRCLHAICVLVAVLLLSPTGEIGGHVRAEQADAKQLEVMVKGGDTLLRIAARHGVTVEDLRAWNKDRIGAGDLIKIGDKLRIRTHAGYEPPEEHRHEGPDYEAYYDIKRGDTLGKVSRRLKVSIADLMQWNNLSGKVIKAGDVLVYRKPGARPASQSKGRSRLPRCCAAVKGS